MSRGPIVLGTTCQGISCQGGESPLSQKRKEEKQDTIGGRRFRFKSDHTDLQKLKRFYFLNNLQKTIILLLLFSFVISETKINYQQQRPQEKISKNFKAALRTRPGGIFPGVGFSIENI